MRFFRSRQQSLCAHLMHSDAQDYLRHLSSILFKSFQSQITLGTLLPWELWQHSVEVFAEPNFVCTLPVPSKFHLHRHRECHPRSEFATLEQLNYNGDLNTKHLNIANI